MDDNGRSPYTQALRLRRTSQILNGAQRKIKNKKAIHKPRRGAWVRAKKYTTSSRPRNHDLLPHLHLLLHHRGAGNDGLVPGFPIRPVHAGLPDTSTRLRVSLHCKAAGRDNVA